MRRWSQTGGYLSVEKRTRRLSCRVRREAYLSWLSTRVGAMSIVDYPLGTKIAAGIQQCRSPQQPRSISIISSKKENARKTRDVYYFLLERKENSPAAWGQLCRSTTTLRIRTRQNDNDKTSEDQPLLERPAHLTIQPLKEWPATCIISNLSW